jgi:hypothetical protein
MADRGDSRPRRREHRAHAVAGVVEDGAAAARDCVAHTWLCVSEAARIAVASASQRRVEPSMSVNMKVRTPEAGRRAW